MYVRIDETGQQHTIPGVDPKDFVAGGERPTASGLYDAVALHADSRSAVQLSGVEIEQGRALNEQIHLAGASFLHAGAKVRRLEASQPGEGPRQLKDIKSARLIAERPLAWGVHTTGEYWYVNGSRDGIVELKLAHPATSKSVEFQAGTWERSIASTSASRTRMASSPR